VTASKASRRERGDGSDAHRINLSDAGGLLEEGIELIFTDRHGGVSKSPYDTLNLAYHTGDNAADVSENRLALSDAIDIPPQCFVYLEQVHGLDVSLARLPAAKKEAGPAEAITLPQTDGAYTTARGLVLSVLTADCVPVAIAFPSAGAIAVVHAGWKGTIGNIAAVALQKMREELGLDPADALAVLGPSIAPCCYEVDKGRAALFVEKYGRNSGVITGKEGRYLDLGRANTLNLLEAGVKEESIIKEVGCTCCDKRYFSYRRDGLTGRQGTFVFLSA
jgi:YfiH family protein